MMFLSTPLRVRTREEVLPICCCKLFVSTIHSGVSAEKGWVQLTRSNEAKFSKNAAAALMSNVNAPTLSKSAIVM